MAGSKINDYAIGDSNIQSVMLTLDKAYKGLHQVSLTNYDNTSESQVAAGSVIENNGGLYKFDSNESISGSPADGTVYVRVVPSGDSATLEYTNTAPTWSDSKQGWYGTGGDANKRYLEFQLFKVSSSWVIKFDSTLRWDMERSRMGNIRTYAMLSADDDTSTEHTIPFDVFTNDINSEWSEGVYTAKQSGMYKINFIVPNYENARYYRILKNNLLVLSEARMGRAGTSTPFENRIEVYAYLDATDNLRITSSGEVPKDGTQFYIERLV